MAAGEQHARPHRLPSASPRPARRPRSALTDTGPTSPDTLHVFGRPAWFQSSRSRSPLSFGAVSLTRSRIDTVRVRNPGGVTLSISRHRVPSNASRVRGSSTPGPVSVAPGDTARIRVTFHPTTSDRRMAAITLHPQRVDLARYDPCPGCSPSGSPTCPRPPVYRRCQRNEHQSAVPFAYRATASRACVGQPCVSLTSTRWSHPPDPATSSGGGNCIFTSPTGAVRAQHDARPGDRGELRHSDHRFSWRVPGGGSVTEPTSRSPLRVRAASSSCASASTTAEQAPTVYGAAPTATQCGRGARVRRPTTAAAPGSRGAIGGSYGGSSSAVRRLRGCQPTGRRIVCRERWNDRTPWSGRLPRSASSSCFDCRSRGGSGRPYANIIYRDGIRQVELRSAGTAP